MTVKKCFLTFLGILFCCVSFFAQAQEEETTAVPEKKTTRAVKGLPTCIDFSEVYTRVIAGDATEEEVEEMTNLAALTMGYVSALQDLYGSRLVGVSSKADEWTFMASINRYCQHHPQLNFQRAVRNVPSILKTMEALKTQEFERCQAFIEKTKESICYPVCKELKP